MPRKFVVKQRIGIPRICAYAPCSKPFTAYRADKVYHTDRCRAYASIARKVLPANSLAVHSTPIEEFEVSDPFAALKSPKALQANEQRKCAYASCDVVFTPVNNKHRYHSDSCRYSAFVDRLRSRTKPNKAKELLADLTKDQKARMLQRLGLTVTPEVLERLDEHLQPSTDTPPDSLGNASEPSTASESDSWFDVLKQPKSGA